MGSMVNFNSVKIIITMKEELQRELIALAEDIIASAGQYDFSQLTKQAGRLSEKITILSFVEKYYDTLGVAEQRRDRTMQKVAEFIEENREEDIFDIGVKAVEEVKPLKSIQKEKGDKSAFVAMEPEVSPVSPKRRTVADAEAIDIPIQTSGKKVSTPIMKEVTDEPEFVIPKAQREEPRPVEQVDAQQFIQQLDSSPQREILKQTPSLEEFISQSQNTVFDKRDTSIDIKPVKSVNDKFGKEVQIGLNDRLAFIQKLFFGSESEYNKVVKRVSEAESMQEAAVFIEQEIKPTYNYWKGKEEFEERFLSLLLKRFEV